MTRAAAALLFAIALLTGCAMLPQAPHTAAFVTPAAGPFDATGRLSARRGSEGVAAHFFWRHRVDHDVIELSTPLGQTVARLSGNATAVQIERPDQPAAQLANWEAVTREAFGVGLPVAGLAAWLRGAPREGATFGVETDGAGRALLLRQDGWEIVYAYRDDAAERRPFRVVLRQEGGMSGVMGTEAATEVRIVIDRWEATP